LLNFASQSDLPNQLVNYGPRWSGRSRAGTMPAAGRTRAEEVRWWAGSAMWREERGELLVRATIGLGVEMATGA
jgi:hypothetical protein